MTNCQKYNKNFQTPWHLDTCHLKSCNKKCAKCKKMADAPKDHECGLIMKKKLSLTRKATSENKPDNLSENGHFDDTYMEDLVYLSVL